MKILLLSFAVLCLALNNGMGAPTMARYMYVKCVPGNGEANCQTHRSPEVEMSLELPSRLPASEAQYIAGEPVEEEWLEGNQKALMETAPFLLGEGSGTFEGSADQPGFAADGSGYPWTESEGDQYKDMGEDALYPPLRDQIGMSQPPEQELKEDDLLQL